MKVCMLIVVGFLASGVCSACMDTEETDRCEKWKDMEHCVTKPMKMLKYCRKTCDFCECKNYYYPTAVCREKKKAEKCTDESVAAACWKTCSRCGEDGTNEAASLAATEAETTTTTTATTTTTKRPKKTTTTTAKTTTKPAVYNCGEPVFHNVGKIVGGSEVVEGSIPWQVSLRRSTTKRHFCGGTLLNNDWVLTAAHCVDWSVSAEDFGIYLGKHHTSEGGKHAEWRLVSHFIVHEEFDSSMLYNDIALMKLEQPVKFTDYIIPICLPSTDVVLKNGEDLYVTGWGDTQNTGNDKVLRMALVPYVENDQCESWLGTILDTEICAGREGKDACQGDSGGPLIKTTNQRSELIGIVSWGIGCALKNKPGVYTRVSKYVHWVNTTMRKSKITSEGMRRPGINSDFVLDEQTGEVVDPDGYLVQLNRGHD